MCVYVLDTHLNTVFVGEPVHAFSLARYMHRIMPSSRHLLSQGDSDTVWRSLDVKSQAPECRTNTETTTTTTYRPAHLPTDRPTPTTYLLLPPHIPPPLMLLLLLPVLLLLLLPPLLLLLRLSCSCCAEPQASYALPGL